MLAVVMQEPRNFPCDSCQCDESGRAIDGQTWSIPGVIKRSSICPRRLVTSTSWFLFDLYRHYRNGVLPVAGGLLDQPYVFFRAMTILSHWMKNA